MSWWDWLKRLFASAPPPPAESVPCDSNSDSSSDSSRDSPQDSSYDFTTKDGVIRAIIDECVRQGLSLDTQIAYVLATVAWETGNTFQPVREAYRFSEEWRKKYLTRYYPYYGRGFVQLTWKENYEKYSKKLNIDLVNNPDLACDPKIALFILVDGLKTGAFTGHALTEFINENRTDFIQARRCVNRLDRAKEIAALAEKYLDQLEKYADY